MSKKTKDLVEGVDYVLNEDGKKVNPETGKELKGFALNPEAINRGGRPKGSRNKSTIAKAQYALDSASEIAVELLVEQVMDTELKASDRRAAAVEILKRSTKEESKRPVEAEEQDRTPQEEEDTTPMFSPVPVEKTG